MKLKLLLLLGLSVSPGLFCFFPMPESVEIVSQESETVNGSPVYNEIKYFPSAKQDVWMMLQSHGGKDLDKSKWDRLAIVIDKTQSPKVASFYQLAPGPLHLASDFKPEPLKARCFACHASGPRIIRPKAESNLTLVEKIRVSLWNLRMKSYGPMVSRAAKDLETGEPFKSKHAVMLREIKLESCSGCHAKDGIRNELRFEHLGTIAFHVDRQIMPPFPFLLSKKDKAILDQLLGKK